MKAAVCKGQMWHCLGDAGEKKNLNKQFCYHVMGPRGAGLWNPHKVQSLVCQLMVSKKKMLFLKKDGSFKQTQTKQRGNFLYLIMWEGIFLEGWGGKLRRNGEPFHRGHNFRKNQRAQINGERRYVGLRHITTLAQREGRQVLSPCPSCARDEKHVWIGPKKRKRKNKTSNPLFSPMQPILVSFETAPLNCKKTLQIPRETRYGEIEGERKEGVYFWASFFR